MDITPRELAVALRTFATREPGCDLGQIDDDHNENDWRAAGTQAVNFRVRLDGREFTVTVEDITSEGTNDV